MRKLLIPLGFLFLSLFVFSFPSFAKEDLPSVTVINMLRGKQLGHEKDNLSKSLKDQWQVTKENNVKATWLWQYSSLEDKDMTNFAKEEMKNQEFGLLFEIDKNFAEKSGVQFKGQGGPWYFSNSLLLVSYDTQERKKLIDTAFSEFKEVFGYYPKTVGAWWLGADSISYMQQKYGIVAALKAADQFNLDFYSIWGSPWSIPYVASRENEAIPAEDFESSSKVVIIQWAARDPTKGYEDPLFSMQDYTSRSLDLTYVNYLSSIFLNNPQDNMVIGLENGGNLEIFNGFYKNMILKAKSWEKDDKAKVVLVKDYAESFLKTREVFSKNNYFLSKDFKSEDQSFWYNTQRYRANIQKEGDKVYLANLHNYINKVKEDYSLLPNSQGHIRVDSPSIIDSLRFEEQRILISETNSSIRIERHNNKDVSLFTNDKRIAYFSPDLVQLFFDNGQKTEFIFKEKAAYLNMFQLLALILLLYLIFLYKTRRKLLKSIAFLFIPLLIAFPFLLNGLTNDLSLIFDKKQLFIFSFLANPNLSFWQIVFLFQILPFALLLIFHHIFISKFKKFSFIFYIYLVLLLLFYAHVPYFPLDRSTYQYVGAAFFLIFVALFSLCIFFFRKNKKRLALSLISILCFITILGLTTIISRSNFVFSPFEQKAIEVIKNQNKDVIYVSQYDFNLKPIYKAFRPLLYENLALAEKLTAKKWQEVSRPDNHVLKLDNYDNKIIVIPRYLGTDISEFELSNLKLTKIFDNAQIAIFEKK